MLDWILEEAHEQVVEACAPNYDAAPSCASSARTGDQTTNTYDTDETSSAEISSVSSTSSSRTEEEAKRPNLQQQSRDPGATSGGSQYFSSLNDLDYIDYAINRSKSILDKENTLIEDLCIGDIETGVMCEVEEKTKKKKWTLKRRTKDHQGHQEQEEDDLEPSGDVFKLANDFTELENLGKEQARRKIVICLFVIFMLVIIAMSGLGVFLAMTWKDGNSSNRIGSSDISYDSENPIVQVNPSIDESFPSVDTATSPTENEHQPSLTARPIEEDNEDYVWANEQQPSPTYRPTARPTGGTPLEEDVGDNNQDSVAASTADDDIVAKHLEAYEQWKQNDNIFLSDEDVDNSVDLDVAVDAKIELDANDRK